MKKLMKLLGLGLFFWVSASWASVSAFVDAQAGWGKNTVVGTDSFSVFINDGAVYFSHEVGGGKLFIDVPFAFSASGVFAATSTAGGLLGAKAQAYVSYAYENGLFWKLGQFDRIYGLERNDTKDLFFATQSMLYTNTTGTGNPFPGVVHTGLLFGYKSGMLCVKGLVANPTGIGLVNSSTAGNPNLGIVVKAKTDTFWARAGYLHSKVAAGSNMFINAVAGMKMDQMSFALEFDYWKAAGASNSSLGVLGRFVMENLMDSLSFALRAEYLNKVNNTNIIGIAAGPIYQMSDALKVKLNYLFNNTSPVGGGSSTTTHGVLLSAVHTLG